MAYDDYLKLRTWSLDMSKTAHVTEKLKSLTWSGSYTDCARRLKFELLADGLCELGGLCRLYHEADILFSGAVRRRGRRSSQQYLSATAYDRGVFLKKNSTYLAVRQQTAEAVTAELCREFGITAGSIAATGVPISRNFLGNSLYQVIQTMYTLAAVQTGKQYQVRFRGDALEVAVKERSSETIRLIPGSNLLSCSSEDSVEDMVTSVGVYDDQYVLTAAYDSPEGFRSLYGLMQRAIKASAYDDPAAEAAAILEDNGLETTITAECLGNTKLITGNAVVVHEPVTGLDGLFWILSDSHTYAGGIYRTTVTLSFRNLMDEQEAGSVPRE